jgi:hypothetical protein
MLGIPAELEQKIVSRLSWTAIKALARASKASRNAARRRVVSLEWHNRDAPLPVADLRQAFPAARRLELRAVGGSASDMRAFLAVNSAFLPQLQHLLVQVVSADNVEPLLAAIVMQCPRLQCLNLWDRALPQLRPLAGLKQLTRLQLGLGHKFSYSALTSAISSITGLRELSVWDFESHSSELRCTTALQRLSRLELILATFHQLDLGCLAAMPSLRSLRFDYCEFEDEPSSLSRLTMLEELALVGCNDTVDEPFQLPLSALAALTSLRSLDLDSRSIPQDLDQQALQQLRPVLAGLGRLSLGRICGVGDPQLLGCIGCTQLEFGGFDGCAEPAAGTGPPLPCVSSLRLTSRAPQLEPLVLLQRGLTSLGLLHSTDAASCEQLSRAFPQLRVLQLGSTSSALGPSSEPSAAGLAHLGALQHLEHLHLVYPRIKPSQLQQPAAAARPGSGRVQPRRGALEPAACERAGGGAGRPGGHGH